MQLEKSSEVIQKKEEEVKVTKRRLQAEIKKIVRSKKIMRSTGINTENNHFLDVIKHLEDEILFKNQEISEFQSEIKLRDSKIFNLELEMNAVTSDQNVKKMENMERLMERIQILESDNKKIDDQLKLQIQERKLLLKKISLLKDQIEDSEKKTAKKDATQQCEIDTCVISKAYEDNLSRFRKTTLALKKRVAESIESLKEFRKDHENFVRMVQLIVDMNDINIRDEIIDLLNQKERLSAIQSEDVVFNEDIHFSDPYSLNSDSCEKYETDILKYLKKEKEQQRKILMKNCSIIFQLEDELLIGDALTDSQVRMIDDLKYNLEKLSNKKVVENEENISSDDFKSEEDQITSFNQKRLPSAFTQRSSKLTSYRSEKDDNLPGCLDENCLVKEKDFLINLLDLIEEEIDSCENDSGVEFDYDESQGSDVERHFTCCHPCSSSLQQDAHDILEKLHHGLPSVLEQVRKLKYFYENVCRATKKAFLESQKKEETLTDYHILIAKLTSENLKLTGEKLVSKSEIEEMKKKNSEIISELEDEICCLNSQLADKEVEGLKAKRTSATRTSHKAQVLRKEHFNNFSTRKTLDSVQESPRHAPTSGQRTTSNWPRASDVKNQSDSDCTTDSEKEEINQGLGLNNYRLLEKNREILDNKTMKNVRKKLPSRLIKNHPRLVPRFSDS
jgi:hypothetical protein